MDHLVIPKGKKHVEVPFIPQERFAGTFEEYPKHQGWSDHELHEDRGFGGKPARQIAGFFQNWLFFGLLADTLTAGGVSWSINDFIVENRHAAAAAGQGQHPLLVSTARLPVIMDEWRRRIVAASTVNTRPPYSTLVQVHSFAIRRFGHFEAYINNCSGEKVPEWPVISLSIAMLGFTFEMALPKIYNSGSENWPSDRWTWSELVKTRMIEAGWTSAEWTKDGVVQLDGWYYFGFLDSPRKHQHCQNCQDPECTKSLLNEDNYVVRHAERCHKSDCHEENVSDQVLEIVRNGKTPLVCWKNDKMTVVESDLTDCYVAISHVWSDGMGNPRENALPVCQLSRIQSLIDRLYSRKRADQQRAHMLFGPKNSLGRRDPSRKPVGFWMDTFCVPVKDDAARKLAIQKMRDIYQAADRTLVLDSWVRALPRRADVVEKATRLNLSNWQNRLWTLQEGILAHNLFIQFKDGPQTLEKLQDELQEDEKSRPELNFYSTLGAALFAVPLLGLRLKTPMHSPPSSLLLPLVGGVISRTTTRLSDETICLATMLDMDPAPLLSLPGPKKGNMSKDEKHAWEQKSCQKRMEHLLQSVGTFELKMIFSNLPRLRSEGFGWAPRSFLNHPGLVVAHSSDPTDTGRTAKVKSDGRGLLLSCPGIILGPLSPHLGQKFTIRQDSTFYCTISLKPEEDQPQTLDMGPNVSYTVLSYVTVGKDSPAEQSEGILGISCGQDDDDDGTRRVRYVCRVHLEWVLEIRIMIEELTLEEPDGEQTISGQWVEDTTKWCLV